jgi:hypothetical protein
MRAVGQKENLGPVRWFGENRKVPAMAAIHLVATAQRRARTLLYLPTLGERAVIVTCLQYEATGRLNECRISGMG